jgi:hypothetical protein
MGRLARARRRVAASGRRLAQAGRWSTIQSLVLEARWRLRRPPPGPPEPPLRSRRPLPALRVVWPEQYGWPPQASWVEPIRLGLEPLVEVRREQLVAREHGVVPFRVESGRRQLSVALNYGDDPVLDPTLLSIYDLVFKMQYLQEGYGSERVVPGGFVPNGLVLYRYLPHLRALRDRGRRTADAYGRFDLRKSIEIRRHAVRLLQEQRSFRYRGGFRRVRYAKGLAEAAQARVCIDLPGLGPLCFRLVDNLAIGVPIVSPAHACRLHVPLVPGVHIAYCEPDVGDLVDVVEDVLADPGRADALAREARAFFDRHLHYRALGDYYLATCIEHL